jgi:low temperature requirement protein LtrA
VTRDPTIRGRARPDFLRARKAGEHGKVTFVELFFDLVFVFAVTQLSHLLSEHFSALGVAHTALLLMAVWWVWIYTSWVTNWLDPETPPVRLLLLGLMLAGLVLSTSLPAAFEESGLIFAAAYVCMQVGRTAFVSCALRRGQSPLVRSFPRILAWFVLSGAFWIAGGLAEGAARLALWGSALLLEYIAPAVGFWTPRLGRSTTLDWNVDGRHMAERCALFIIIALGESILVTGATFADRSWSPATVAAFVVSFVGSVAMWWVYFDTGAERGSRHISLSTDPGRQARLAYTYLHLPIVAGVIVAAVADKFVLDRPTGNMDVETAAAVLGGPALYLFGNLLFKRTVAGRLPLSHLVGLGLLVALTPVASAATPLVFNAAATLVLVMVAVWETRSLRRHTAMLEP